MGQTAQLSMFGGLGNVTAPCHLGHIGAWWEEGVIKSWSSTS